MSYHYASTMSSLKLTLCHTVTHLLLLLNIFVFDVFVDGLNFYERIFFIIGSSNPCYVRDRTQPAADECEHIIIPTGFCEVCGISTAVRSNGEYENCLYTSGVETLDGVVNMACLDKMQQYVNMNPCDMPRATGLKQYRERLSLPNYARRLRTRSRQIMDSFVYGICELSCDCVPQYAADVNKRAFDVQRGNCQGHALYDVCQIYPNIKVIEGEANSTFNENRDLSTIPAVCPYIREWRKDNPGDWFDMTPTTVDPIVETFLIGTIDAAEMITSNNDTLWQQCFYVESTQQEIVPI